jgi:hypothetical protein
MLLLDDIATGDLEAERELHEANLSGIPTTDRAAVAAEFDRHLNRTSEIMRAFRDRQLAERETTPPAV